MVGIMVRVNEARFRNGTWISTLPLINNVTVSTSVIQDFTSTLTHRDVTGNQESSCQVPGDSMMRTLSSIRELERSCLGAIRTEEPNEARNVLVIYCREWARPSQLKPEGESHYHVCQANNHRPGSFGAWTWQVRSSGSRDTPLGSECMVHGMRPQFQV